MEGRSDDLVELPEGRRVGRLEHEFKEEWPNWVAQIIHRNDYRVDALIVAATNSGAEQVWSAERSARLNAAVREQLGPELPIKIRISDRTTRATGNKFSAAVHEKGLGQ